MHGHLNGKIFYIMVFNRHPNSIECRFFSFQNVVEFPVTCPSHKPPLLKFYAIYASACYYNQ